MQVGLYAVDSKMVNLALMKISTYHKNRGDDVKWYMPVLNYDKVYISKLFTFTKLPQYYMADKEIGGTGYDIKSKLKDEIEVCEPDYSIYPDCTYSIQFFSRGCIRNCKFCVVREKEGLIHPVKPMRLNPNGQWIEIFDNNFFANPEWKEAIKSIHEWNQPVNFHGIDARIITEEQAYELSKIKTGSAKLSTWGKKENFGKLVKKGYKIAWDNPRDDALPGIKRMIKYIKPYNILCYVLIGFNSTEEEDLYRVRTLNELGVKPFVMPFDKKDPYQKKFARWVNMKAIFNKVKWEDYK